MRHWLSLLLVLATLCGCGKYIGSLKDGRFESNVALRQLSLEVEELKGSLQQAHLEISALEDRIQSQESTLVAFEKGPNSSGQVQELEKRLEELKLALQLSSSELKALNAHANSTNDSLVGYRDKIQDLEQSVKEQNNRLIEVTKLRSTLASISKAVREQQGPASSSDPLSYEVQPGDTLGKIAVKHGTTVPKLKELNNLSSTKIIVGQTLKLR